MMERSTLIKLTRNIFTPRFTTINIYLNTMAFAFDTSIQWRIKYNSLVPGNACPTPDKEDFDILNDILLQLSDSSDIMVLNAAIDWYNHGKSAKNIITEFLCHYIALECVAIAVAEGHADFGLNYPSKNKTERRRDRLECIETLKGTLFR